MNAQPAIHHPEQKEDEIYMGNESTSNFLYHKQPACVWKSKRLGRQAFYFDGTPIKDGMRPVFIKRSEVEAAISDKYRKAHAAQYVFDQDLHLNAASTLTQLLERGRCL